MPSETSEFKLRAVVEGLEDIPSKIARGVELGLRIGVRQGGIADIFTGMTGGILQMTRAKAPAPVKIPAGAMGMTEEEAAAANEGAAGAGKAAAGAASGGAAIAGPVAGAMVGVGILQHISEILEGLAPIKAIMTVVKAILELAFMPLAMVLMAILMPFLLPLLQILAKFPWAAFAKDMQGVSAWITKYLPYIIDIVVPVIGFWNLAKWAFPMIVSLITSLWNGFVEGIKIWEGFFAWVLSFLQPVFTVISEAISGAWNVLSSIWDWFSNTMGQVFQDISIGVKAIANALGAAGNAGSSIWKDLTGWVPHFASGGYVPQTTLAMVHAGETVLPAGGKSSGAGTTINVTVTGNNISNQMDLNKIAAEVAQQISNKMRLIRTW